MSDSENSGSYRPLRPEERERKDSAADLWCPDCGQKNTVWRPPKPVGKWSGVWECVECEWSGYPRELVREYRCHICGGGKEAHDKAGRCPTADDFGEPPEAPERYQDTSSDTP